MRWFSSLRRSAAGCSTGRNPRSKECSHAFLGAGQCWQHFGGPSVLRASNARGVKGKYKIAPEKLVSTFSKEQLGQMPLLNRRRNCPWWSVVAKCLVFCDITKGSYEFFTDRSGLPDAHSAMLVSGAGRLVRRFHRVPFHGPWPSSS